MKWSFKLGEFAGIGVYVHATFFLLIFWLVATSWLHGQGAAAAAASVIFLLALFTCVVLHEFGHALAARRFGIRTRDITLLPIGGVALILTGSQQDFPVALGDTVVGVLTRTDLLRGLAQQERDTRVEAVMRREFQVVDPAEMLEGVFARLQECECRTLPVVRQGRLVGIVTMDNVGEFLAIQAALAGRKKAWA